MLLRLQINKLMNGSYHAAKVVANFFTSGIVYTASIHTNTLNLNHSAKKIFQSLSQYHTSPSLHSTEKNKLVTSTNPSSIIKLPTIDAIVNKIKASKNPQPLADKVIVYIHHPLQTSVTLLEAMIRLGAKPENIFVLGKHYSECPSVVQQVKDLGVYYQDCSKQIGLALFNRSFNFDLGKLWLAVSDHLDMNSKLKRVMILDHGGNAVNLAPQELLAKYDVVGVEKTTGGLINIAKQGILPPFPIIGVANCAAKKVLESPLIAQAVVDKLEKQGLLQISTQKKYACGVVGYGAIGAALAAKLVSLGHKVIVYDNDKNQLKAARHLITTDNISALVASADYIFGCTGQDISESLDPYRLSKADKTLISCSSEDIEFLSLLRTVQKLKNGKVAKEPLKEIEYKTDMDATIRIFRGGFPANFDHSGESVPAKDIDLTRSLVLGAVLQANTMFEDPELLESDGVCSLNTGIQKFVANTWLKGQPEDRYSKSITDNFQNEGWIQENSGGRSLPCNTVLGGDPIRAGNKISSHAVSYYSGSVPLFNPKPKFNKFRKLEKNSEQPSMLGFQK